MCVQSECGGIPPHQERDEDYGSETSGHSGQFPKLGSTNVGYA